MSTDRFRLHRAGILNVWQYDDQVFTLADGRMLLRGANGAGKSKTLEMLLPFVLDGDKARITASARHHTSLLWLMTDGYDGQARIGYLWVEFRRDGAEGEEQTVTCGVGIRSTAAARSASAWFFTTPRRIGHDLHLEDEGGPLSRPRLEAELGAEGHVFDQAQAYKEHVGRSLFGLEPAAYDEVLRLLYWLRQPQVGEDIEPARLAGQLSQALPPLEERAVRAAGETFDELTTFAEQIVRRSAAARALGALAKTYAGYARDVVAARARAAVRALTEERRRQIELRRREQEHEEVQAELAEVGDALDRAAAEVERVRSRRRELQDGPEALGQKRLADLDVQHRQQQRAAEEDEARAERDARAADDRQGRVLRRATELHERWDAQLDTVRRLEARRRDAGVEAAAAVPAVLDDARLEVADGAVRVADALATTAGVLEDLRTATGRREAAVHVVAAALDELDRARSVQGRAEQVAGDAETRWEESRALVLEAAQVRTREAHDLIARVASWVADPTAPAAPPGAALLGTEWSIEAADEVAQVLDPARVEALPVLARSVAASEVEDAAREAREAGVALDRAGSALADLAQRRAAVEAERDPVPPPPALARSPRPRHDAASLWQVVDFREAVDDAARAGLEAALQAAGLLDAWVRPGGRLLDPGSHDVVLRGVDGEAGSAGTLLEALRPDVPHGAAVEAADVEAVLRGVRLVPDAVAVGVDGGAVPSSDAVVARDGGWRLGPLVGRATKPRAQFVGATARAEERRRRLAELDRLVASAEAARSAAEAALARAEDRIVQLTAWVDRVPSGSAFLTAWIRGEERREQEGRAQVAHARAEASAQEARSTTARALAAAEREAAQHGVPLDRASVTALAERLRRLEVEADRAAEALKRSAEDVRRWVDDRRDLDRVLAEVEEQRRRAQRSAEEAGLTSARLEELRAAVGSTVRELEERLAVLRRQEEGLAARVRALGPEKERLLGTAGVAAERVVSARAAVQAFAEQRAGVLADVAALARVPGLLLAAGQAEEEHVLAGAATLASDDPVPGAVRRVLARAAELSLAEPDGNLVWRAQQEAMSGPAADHEPSVASFGDLLGLGGRDEKGETTLSELAVRVAAAVERDRELLTARERQRFEQHVLGELGDAIRRCRLEAQELVDAMNELLGGITTSQGIRVRLDWRLRDDVPAETREAVRLLGQPVGALLPEEREVLRDALHRLIEASRTERPELSYADHLAVALDYRAWFAFAIRYTRPEAGGTWQHLHRRSPLSQGEQKVLCYLPLFAAAAAHFSSLAGAAPHAPRLVLLDDAFPKIDVRTHPLLFGLLVDLDLDFVITSERLWGDHGTVPSLAIYEALRDPAQRGIAQFEYRWDGRRMHALG